MVWRGGGTDGAEQTINQIVLQGLDRLTTRLLRVGYLKLFILGLAIGIGVGILGGRAAERLRLADYVAIEQMILDRERPPDRRPLAPPRLRTPAEPSRM